MFHKLKTPIMTAELKYLKVAINIALSSILKDLNNEAIADKKTIKESARKTISQLEKIGFDAVFSLEGRRHTVLAYNFNTLEKTWQIEKGESFKDIARSGKIDYISFCENGGEEVSGLFCDYDLEIDFETGIITAKAEYDGDLYEVTFENGTETACNFDADIEFFEVERRVIDMLSDWQTQKEYDSRNEIKDWSNYHRIENHL